MSLNSPGLGMGMTRQCGWGGDRDGGHGDGMRMGKNNVGMGFRGSYDRALYKLMYLYLLLV